MISRLLKWIKGNLSAKIFLSIFTILFVVCLSMFCFLWMFIPRNYEKELAAQTVANFEMLAEQIEKSDIALWDKTLLTFCVENKSTAIIEDEDGNTVSQVVINATEIGRMLNVSSFVSGFTWNGRDYTLLTYISESTEDNLSIFFLSVLPYTIGVIVIISVLAATLYSRILAKPILTISHVSKRMAELDTTWRCDIKRTDEIGVLANNLNEMAVKLDTALYELQNANEKLLEDIEKERIQDKQRSNLFMAISHELKTPLTILKCDLDGMINNLGRYKDRDKYLQHAFQTTDELETLTREILTISRMESSDFKLEFSEIALTPVIQKISDIYGALAKTKDIIINTSCDEDIHCIADSTYIENALSNIISNAINHSPAGESINIELKRLDGNSVLTIENSGVQISQDDIEQVFQPFYRADKSRSRHTGGSGLGLFIVKTILELHQFSYKMYNTSTGICFMIKFPLL